MLPQLLWLWLPISLFLGSAVFEQFLDPRTGAWLVGEGGPYELLQFFIIALGVPIALYVLARMDRSKPWLVAWIGVAALGCLYVAGEEVSWGQHFLKWESSAFWAQVNDQNETNFHNMSSWLDQKPRILLIIGVYVGGLIIPVLMRLKPTALPDRYTVIYPTYQFVPTALICLTIKLYDSLGDLTGINIFWRSAETEEFFIYYFVVLYLTLMVQRLVRGRVDAETTDTPSAPHTQ